MQTAAMLYTKGAKTYTFHQYVGLAEKLVYLLIFTFILIFFTFFLDEKSNQRKSRLYKKC
ncbi:MAG: hypothetical protein RL711_1611 [Bacteroidota bacterium]